MEEPMRLQGRSITTTDLQRIQELVVGNPGWSRWRISRHLAAQWNWRNGVGQLKDMAVRSLLLKLHQRDLVRLPERRRQPTNRMRCPQPVDQAWEQSPIVCSLGALTPLSIREVSGERGGRRLFCSALSQFHYLGHGGSVGENLQYIISNKAERPLAFLLFGSAAWKCQDRDRFIGWNSEQRQRNLFQITNNTRFLVLPWVQVPHLASWALGRVLRRLSQDWEEKYGHPIVLVETFVQKDRFAGTAYRSANWIKVGRTTGRTRQDRSSSIHAPVKDIYVYPSSRDFREKLCA